MLKAIKDEINETKSHLTGFERKTIIEDEIEELNVAKEELISKDEAIVMISHEGYIKRMSRKAFSALQMTEDGQTKVKDGDVISDLYECYTTDVLLQFTDLGNYVYLPVYRIPECKHKDIGTHISTLIGMENGENVVFSTIISDFSEDKYVLIATKDALIKRIKIDKLDVNRYSKVLKATKLRDGDYVVSADICTGLKKEVVIATKEGYMNRYDAEEISVIEPASFGVKAIEMKSRPKDYVIGAKYVDKDDLVLILTNRGNIKRLKPEEILKGKKNHVGKMYLKVVRSNLHEAVALDVIHHKNANNNNDNYVITNKGAVPIDYTVLRLATSDNGRKMIPAEMGEPITFAIFRNNNDLEL